MAKKKEQPVSKEIWQRYAETKSEALRNQILMEYLYIATVNAKRMRAVYQNKADMEDIVNHGVIALIECIERYDYTKDVQFDSYASIRVRGSIIDYVRKQDWIPRDIRKKSVDIHNAVSQLQAGMDHEPSDEEIAAHLGVSMEEFNRVAFQTHSFALLSYEKLVQDNLAVFSESTARTEQPEGQLTKDELRKVIASSVDELTEKERLIITLYYYEELKLKEIAVILGLTASRVSQLHAKALKKMEAALSEYMKL